MPREDTGEEPRLDSDQQMLLCSKDTAFQEFVSCQTRIRRVISKMCKLT